MTFSPCLVRSSTASGDARFVLGDPLVDRYLEFAAGRARPNTLLAVAFDLKTLLSVHTAGFGSYRRLVGERGVLEIVVQVLGLAGVLAR
jgi:hypothetical protein